MRIIPHLALFFTGIFIQSCTSETQIEGKYRTNDGYGSTAEFLKDGTLIFISGGKQSLWAWQKVGDDRLKLDPGAGLPGTRPAVCRYVLADTKITLEDCHLKMTLTRI